MNLDIPKSDIECWERYTKHHWVYDLSRLLDAQNFKWRPFKTSTYSQPMVNLNISKNTKSDTGHIYICPVTDPDTWSEIYVIKGEIKHIRYINESQCTDTMGEVDLRLNAFITLYFQRFTGVLTVQTIKNTIFSISLKPFDSSYRTAEIEKLLKKIYKNLDEVATDLV